MVPKWTVAKNAIHASVDIDNRVHYGHTPRAWGISRAMTTWLLPLPFFPHCFIIWTQTAVPLFTVFRLMATQGPVMVLTWVKLQDMFWGVNYTGRFPESSVETHQPPWCLWSVLSYSVKASYVLWDLVSPLSVDEPFNTHVLLEFFCDVK